MTPGKGYGLVCPQRRQDSQPIYALIAANQAELPVRTLCKTLKVSASGFYSWQRPVRQRQQASAVLITWVADMTYIPAWTGFLYLAMVIDVYSRRLGPGVWRAHAR